MWTKIITFGSAIFVVVFSHLSAQADMLWLYDSEAPVSGIVVKQSASSVEYRYRVGEEEKTIQVERGEIKELIVTIDQEALERLKPTDLRAYLDMAESLASFRSDKYAMDVAKRLCLLTARWGSSELRISAFCLLDSICDGDELLSVRRLALIYESSIELKNPQDREKQELSAESVELTLRIVRLIWRGESQQAQELLSDERVLTRVQPVVLAHSGVCSLEELVAASNVEKVSVSQLGRLLRLEQALTEGEPPIPRTTRLGENWFSASGQVGKVGVLLPEFENVLPFDPQLTIYRDGKWVASSGK